MLRRVRLFLPCLLLVLFATPAMASIIKKPPAKAGEVAYKDLVCTDEQKACIYEIISAMGENGKLGLLFKQNHLKALGDRISDVHPMKFLETIFANPYLKTCMMTIWNDYFKRNGFMEGLAPSLTREMEKNNLMQHINEFGTTLGIPGEHMKAYFEKSDWENLVLFLIQS